MTRWDYLLESDEDRRKAQRSNRILRELEDDPSNGELWQEARDALRRHDLRLTFRTKTAIWGNWHEWRVFDVRRIEVGDTPPFYRIFFGNHHTDSMTLPLSLITKSADGIEFSVEPEETTRGNIRAQVRSFRGESLQESDARLEMLARAVNRDLADEEALAALFREAKRRDKIIRLVDNRFIENSFTFLMDVREDLKPGQYWFPIDEYTYSDNAPPEGSTMFTISHTLNTHRVKANDLLNKVVRSNDLKENNLPYTLNELEGEYDYVELWDLA